MDRFIGLDVHAASCTMVVVGPSGRKLNTMVLETNGEALIGAISAIPGRRHICLEEGTQAGWLAEILEPFAHELVVAGVQKSQGNKNDKRDALGLAQALRLNAIDRRVFKKMARYRNLRQLARVYRMIVGDVVRIKNRLKSIFRGRGISTVGNSVYGLSDRSDCLAQLDPASRLAARTLYAQLDAMLPIRDDAQKAMLAQAQRHPICSILKTTPGFGPVRVAQVVPIVVTPHRFRTARQYWSYCGLGIVTRSSSDWIRAGEQWVKARVPVTRGLNRNHNRTLKAIYKGAATTVIKQDHGPLRDHYERMLDEGTKPNLAKLTIARKISALSLSMWKHEEKYDPQRAK